MGEIAKPLPGDLRKALDAAIQSGELVLCALHMAVGEGIAATSERVIIVKAGWITGAGPFGKKVMSYRYDQITSVEHREGPLGGHIKLLTAGVLESRPDNSLFGSDPNYKKENVVTYGGRATRAQVRELVALIEAKVMSARDGAKRPASPDAGLDVVGELERLVSLHASGALSDQEFSAAKQRILGSNP